MRPGVHRPLRVAIDEIEGQQRFLDETRCTDLPSTPVSIRAPSRWFPPSNATTFTCARAASRRTRSRSSLATPLHVRHWLIDIRLRPPMPEFFESIPDRLIPWLLDQPVFWVASAPLSKDGHVNLSPKGLKGSFRVNDPNEVWYEDLMGSGAFAGQAVQATGAQTLIFRDCRH